MADWNPDAYSRYHEVRLRPALDLLMNIGMIGAGEIVDLGCGDGAAASSLRSRFPKRVLVGVDASPAMLDKANGYDRLMRADVAAWQPETPPALIFSNAVLHWLPDHAVLLPRLAAMLAPGGVLAVQMPRQFAAPSHRFLRDIAAAMYPDKFDFAQYEAPVRAAVTYWQMLAPLGEVAAWETEYVQRLQPSAEGHPVRRFTESTAMRPFLAKLKADEAVAFVSAYETALASAYPLQDDGSALFPFRRCFFTLKV